MANSSLQARLVHVGADAFFGRGGEMDSETESKKSQSLEAGDAAPEAVVDAPRQPRNTAHLQCCGQSGAEHVGRVHGVEIFLDRLNLAVTHHE